MNNVTKYGEFMIGDKVEHVNPSNHIHGNRKSDQTKGEVVRIAIRPYGPSLFIKHEGRKAPIEWALSYWRKLS